MRESNMQGDLELPNLVDLTPTEGLIKESD